MAKGKRIYILCDMEGASGIWQPEQVQSGQPEYQQGRELLMADVNAAIAGAYDGGATDVVVCDTHGAGLNFVLERMDHRPVYETPASGSPMPSLDDSFRGLILTGHHAMAGTLNGFLDHTMDSTRWFCFKINGEPVGEIGMETAHAGHYDVPLIMVSGDEAACAEAAAAFPEIATAAVKRGLGRNRAHCMHPDQARRLIQKSAEQAIRNTRHCKPWTLEAPIELELTYYRSDYADAHASRPGVTRLDARTVRWSVSSAAMVCR